MRVRLFAGQQKFLIDSAKIGCSWEELAKKVGVSSGYLRNELRKEERILSEEAYYKLCGIVGLDLDSFIVELLEDDWGRSKGGRVSRGNTKSVAIPEDSEDLAELYSILLGDGNLTRIKKFKIGVYQMRIVGDCRLDREYLLNFVKPLIERNFKVKTRLFKIKKSNALNLDVHGKELISFFELKGFKPGNKIKNKLGIPDWIKKNQIYLKACLRGLYDTDGSVYKITNQNSYQICFTNYNLVLLNDVRDSLLSLGINVSKITKGRDILITKKSELRRFLNEVNFRNTRHLNKLKVFGLI